MLRSQKFGYPDKALPRDLAYGMGVAGAIETTNPLAPRIAPETTNLGRAKSSLRVRNGSIGNALLNARDPILKNKRRRRSMEEFHKGWLSELNPVTNFDRRIDVLPPLFCTTEQRGLQEPKYRATDDLAKSLLGGEVKTTETYRPQDVDSFVALTRLQKSHVSHHLRAWSLDFSRAYKTIAHHPGSAEASYTCIINHADNRPYTARILVQPFGSRRAPANWGRVVTCIQFVAHKLIYVEVWVVLRSLLLRR